MILRKVLLGLGSNLGDRRASLDAAGGALARLSHSPLRASPIYESPAMGGENGAGAYLNQVVEIETDLSALDLLFTIKGLERILGRRQRGHWMSREIDIDILFYGQDMIQEGRFCVPHAGLHLRQFMLRPLCDLDSARIHPKLGRTLASLYDDLLQSEGDHQLKVVGI